MNPKGKILLGVIGTILSTEYPSNHETVGQEVEKDEIAEPWRLRLHGANKDRRAARKKRAKKLNRRK